MNREALFVETIRVCRGVPQNLSYHQSRMDKTAANFFPDTHLPPLADVVNRPFPDGLLKLRVLYGSGGIVSSQCDPYNIRSIKTLKVVDGGDVDYSFKFADRSRLNQLKALAYGCDDVIIVKNGLVTDTSYTNIAISDGNDWLTPRLPLLKGTRRAQLLDSGVIVEASITVDDLMSAVSLRLFNAMIEFGEVELSPEAIQL